MSSGQEMNFFSKREQRNFWRRVFCGFLAIPFLTLNLVGEPNLANAQMNPALPPPGTRLSTTQPFFPSVIKGLTIQPQNPLQFQFIIDTGDSRLQGEPLRQETGKLIKYFLASLTVPEEDLWVNLSPYEKDRIMPKNFGETEMGRDLLAQDYLLKQLTASLLYPENELGKNFWTRVYAKAQQLFGTTDIPVDTFHKIWILPEEAVVYEQDHSAFVVRSRLKVMLEEDYFGKSKINFPPDKGGLRGVLKANKPLLASPCQGRDCSISTEIIREILIPEIEREVNEGKTFANLRQIYNAMILATWYKESLKESLLGRVYVDLNKVKGIDVDDKKIKEKIYAQYLAAFKQGVYNYIKEEYDPARQEIIPRKYFSGGLTMRVKSVTRFIRAASVRNPSSDYSMLTDGLQNHGQTFEALVSLLENANKNQLAQAGGDDQAMLGDDDRRQYIEDIQKLQDLVNRLTSRRNPGHIAREEFPALHDSYQRLQRAIAGKDIESWLVDELALQTHAYAAAKRFFERWDYLKNILDGWDAVLRLSDAFLVVQGEPQLTNAELQNLTKLYDQWEAKWLAAHKSWEEWLTMDLKLNGEILSHAVTLFRQSNPFRYAIPVEAKAIYDQLTRIGFHYNGKTQQDETNVIHYMFEPKGEHKGKIEIGVKLVDQDGAWIGKAVEVGYPQNKRKDGFQLSEDTIVAEFLGFTKAGELLYVSEDLVPAVPTNPSSVGSLMMMQVKVGTIMIFNYQKDSGLDAMWLLAPPGVGLSSENPDLGTALLVSLADIKRVDADEIENVITHFRVLDGETLTMIYPNPLFPRDSLVIDSAEWRQVIHLDKRDPTRLRIITKRIEESSAALRNEVPPDEAMLAEKGNAAGENFFPLRNEDGRARLAKVGAEFLREIAQEIYEKHIVQSAAGEHEEEEMVSESYIPYAVLPRDTQFDLMDSVRDGLAAILNIKKKDGTVAEGGRQFYDFWLKRNRQRLAEEDSKKKFEDLPADGQQYFLNLLRGIADITQALSVRRWIQTSSLPDVIKNEILPAALHRSREDIRKTERLAQIIALAVPAQLAEIDPHFDRESDDMKERNIQIIVKLLAIKNLWRNVERAEPLLEDAVESLRSGEGIEPLFRQLPWLPELLMDMDQFSSSLHHSQEAGWESWRRPLEEFSLQTKKWLLSALLLTSRAVRNLSDDDKWIIDHATMRWRSGLGGTGDYVITIEDQTDFFVDIAVDAPAFLGREAISVVTWDSLENLQAAVKILDDLTNDHSLKFNRFAAVFRFIQIFHELTTRRAKNVEEVTPPDSKEADRLAIGAAEITQMRMIDMNQLILNPTDRALLTKRQEFLNFSRGYRWYRDDRDRALDLTKQRPPAAPSDNVAKSRDLLEKENVGGINLNPKLLNLQIKRDGRGVPLPLEQQPLDDMKIDGFFPVIIRITPIPNLPLRLGITGEKESVENTS